MQNHFSIVIFTLDIQTGIQNIQFSQSLHCIQFSPNFLDILLNGLVQILELVL